MNKINIERKKKKLGVYLDFLEGIQSLSQSSRLQVASIALKKDFEKVFSGYNGSVKNADIIPETGTEEESLDPGHSGFIHAEINLIAKFNEPDPENYIVIITHSPCSVCSKVLVNAGFRNIFWIREYRETNHIERIFNGRVDNYGNVQDLLSDDMINNIWKF